MKLIKAKSINGRPTSAAEFSAAKLLVGSLSKPEGLLSWVANISNKVNLVEAGMYTGVTCCGAPYEERSYSEQGASAPIAKSPPASVEAELSVFYRWF